VRLRLTSPARVAAQSLRHAARCCATQIFHFKFPILVALMLSAAAGPLSAQGAASNDNPPQIPFAEWITETKRADLPWSINVSSPQLSVLQRFAVEFRVRVPAKALRLLGPTCQLALDVRLKETGAERWLDDHEIVQSRVLERMPKQNSIEFSVQALVQPGNYTAGFILFDRISGKRSVATRVLRVRSLGGDPLPEISRNLPPVEFFQRGVDQDREALPEIKSRLWLPVPTRRPVQIELLVNFAPPEPAAGPPGMSGVPASAERNARTLRARHQRSVGHMLGMLKVFSQMEIPNGSLHITALDIPRRNVFFEQDAAGELDWPRLRAALARINPLSIPIQALEGRRQNAAFFRELLQRRLPQPDPAVSAHAGNGSNGGSDAAPSAPEPLRIFIIVSAPMVFERGSDLSPAVAPRGADYRVYHFEYRFGVGYMWDDLPRLLRELAPRRFDLQTAEDFRRAMAHLLQDLRAQ
jgi:hypothetical protein